MYHNLMFFDFEVYPEWWCVTFSKEEETYPGGNLRNEFTQEDEKRIKDKMITFRSDYFNAEQFEQLKNIADDYIISGYNIKHYDKIILCGVLNGYTPSMIFMLSQAIMSEDIRQTSFVHNTLYNECCYGYKSKSWQDLMDDSNKSLKDKEASLGMDIRETTVPFDKTNLTEQEKNEIIFYNKHDVYALHVFYVCVTKAFIDTKSIVGKLFNTDPLLPYKCTNPTLVAKILNAKRVSGTSIIDPTLTIHDKKFDDYFTKYLPPDIYEYLKKHTESMEFELFGNVVSIGDGGLHSVYKTPNVGTARNYIPAPLFIDKNDEWIMLNVDVSSFYPSIMIYCNAMSRAITDPSVFIGIYNERIKIKNKKANGIELTQDEKDFLPAAKLPMNGAYGAMGNKYLDLFDEYRRSKVCRVGQMILISLSNQLYQEVPDLKVIQTNTDGVLVYVKKEYQDLVKSIVDEFTKMSKFLFEIEQDDRLWQLNVNNYIAEHPNGSLKQKGGVFKGTVFCEGYNFMSPMSNFCVTKAIIQFYVNNRNPVEYIFTNTNIEDFVQTCTKGPTYTKMIQQNKDGNLELGRVARVIAVKDDNFGIIKKIGINKRETKNRKVGDIKEDSVPQCPIHPLVVNDALYNYKIDNHKLIHLPTNRSWDIDYSYYVNILDEQLNDKTMKWYELRGNELLPIDKFNL